MRRLVLAWAVWRLARTVAAIALIAALGMLLLSSGGVTGHSGLTCVEHTARPLVRDLEQTLEKSVKP
jgi:hypothetical protein